MKLLKLWWWRPVAADRVDSSSQLYPDKDACMSKASKARRRDRRTWAAPQFETCAPKKQTEGPFRLPLWNWGPKTYHTWFMGPNSHIASPIGPSGKEKRSGLVDTRSQSDSLLGTLLQRLSDSATPIAGELLVLQDTCLMWVVVKIMVLFLVLIIIRHLGDPVWDHNLDNHPYYESASISTSMSISPLRWTPNKGPCMS